MVYRNPIHGSGQPYKSLHKNSPHASLCNDAPLLPTIKAHTDVHKDAHYKHTHIHKTHTHAQKCTTYLVKLPKNTHVQTHTCTNTHTHTHTHTHVQTHTQLTGSHAGPSRPVP